MPLKIVRAADPIAVERLNVVLYGPPGIGKTSLAFTAADPLLLDFDQGAHRAHGRRDIVQVRSWDDVAGISAADLEPFRTVVVDTAGRALDVLSADIIRASPKLGRGGALTLQGFGELKARFIAFLKLLNGFGKDVVLIAHMDEQRSGDELIERLDVQGGSKGEIYKAADAMGRLVIRDGKRLLNFSPTDAAFGKNPGQLDPLQVPAITAPEFHTFLAGVVAQIKARLNEQTEEQRATQANLEQWRTSIANMDSAEEFNAALPAVKQQPQAVQALLAKSAAALGFQFDKATGSYVMPSKAA